MLTRALVLGALMSLAAPAVANPPTCPASFPVPSSIRQLRCELRDWVCECGPDGQLLREVQDMDFDGTPDLIVRYRYDGAVLVGVEIDLDAAGEAEGQMKLYYDGEGRLRLMYGDAFARGVAATVALHYDEESAFRAIETDLTGDGMSDQYCTISPPCAPPYEGCASPDCP